MPDKLPQNIEVPISPGELIDKLAILEIKVERIADPQSRANVVRELDALTRVRDRAVRATPALSRLAGDLKTVNAELWQIEDDLRDCERRGDFGPGFIALARAVYRTNDRRAALKREINLLLGSALVEEKSYTRY